MKQLIRRIFRSAGLELTRHNPGRSLRDAFPDLSADELNIISTVKPFTATSPERIATLIDAVKHLTVNKIEGDIVECGVWRGGSMMTVALTLMAQKDTSRSLYLYDTFEGMSAPSERDKNLEDIPAESLLKSDAKGTGVWCYASLEDVRSNIFSTGYPEERIHLIKGKVEDTIPQVLPSRLALLRLDTDWYESTKHELTHLFPILDQDGVLIIDDYGHWKGARQAVDEYFTEHRSNIYFHRIDYTGRIAVGKGSLKR